MTQRHNKNDVLEHISGETGVSMAEAGRMLSAFTGFIANAMKNDIEVRLTGFGTFSSPGRKESRRRNPRTGEALIIPARRVPRFRPGKNLVNACSEVSTNG